MNLVTLLAGIATYLGTALNTALDALADSMEIPTTPPAEHIEIVIPHPNAWYVEDPDPGRHTENIAAYVSLADFTVEPSTNGSIDFLPKVDIYFTFKGTSKTSAQMKALVAQYLSCFFTVIGCESKLGGLVDYCMISGGDNGVDQFPNGIVYTLLVSLQIGKEITF